ncbi:MAG TPA: AAA family ATPase [Terriglobales bacterium]|nr:AAA family ATPase [Terriglobales bacterium]
MIILMAGLPGTGKSTLAKALAAKLSGTILSKDTIRHAIFDPRDVEYSTEQDDFCMEIMLQAAAYIFQRDHNRYIFLDGRTFSRRYQIDRAIDFAQHLSQPWRILECTCSDETAKTRLEQASDHPAGNRDFDLYQEVKCRFEPITLPKSVVDTDTPVDECIASALPALKT